MLIKIHKTAICGTDVHIYNWDPWSQQHINPPMVIGHEYVGEIAALGPGVTEYKVGQIVSGEGHIVCGHCRNCRAGNGQWCKETKGVGVDRQGAFAEYVCIPKTNVILMPDDIPEDIISFFDAYGNATHTATMFDVVGEDVLITGEIAALGPGVTEYKVGQIVSGEGHIVCGHCRNCRAGNGQWCKETKGVGVDRQGAFAEYVCIPKTNVILMPDDIPEDIISFFDAYGNATHTATMFDVVGEDVLITGAGPIGMMAVGICRQNGARNIIVTDVNDYRLNIAKQMGATATVNLTHEKLEDAMAAHRMVEGFDVGLEMSGNGKALNQLLKSMRNGGKVALLGIAGPGTVIDWNDVIFKGLNIQGIYGRKMFETWYKMIAMIQAGLDLTPVITHRYHYTEFEKGFEAMNSGHSGKVILSWEK